MYKYILSMRHLVYQKDKQKTSQDSNHDSPTVPEVASFNSDFTYTSEFNTSATKIDT